MPDFKRVAKIAASDLFVSTPNPSWFGNPPNDGKTNWLTSRFHFSFAEWRGGRSQFGCLRVLNDDYVLAKRGFGEHPHSNMEIITYILEGELTHADSMGTSETLTRGAIQFMTAGTGVRHQEHNLNKTKPLRFIQTWVLPRSSGLQPNYGSMQGSASVDAARNNAWVHLVKDVKNGTAAAPVAVNQDINLFVAELDAGKVLDFDLRQGRQVYLVCVEGSATAAGKSLERHAALEITGPGKIEVEAVSADERCHLMLYEMSA